MALEGLFRVKKLYKEDRITGDLSLATVTLRRERGPSRQLQGKIGSPNSSESGYPTQVAGEGKLIIEVEADVVIHIEPVL